MPEGAWVLSSAVHGRGVATEAVRAALEWIDRHYGGNTTTCIIDPENAASIRLAEKVGYREYARSQYKDSKVIQFRRQRP